MSLPSKHSYLQINFRAVGNNWLAGCPRGAGKDTPLALLISPCEPKKSRDEAEFVAKELLTFTLDGIIREKSSTFDAKSVGKERSLLKPNRALTFKATQTNVPSNGEPTKCNSWNTQAIRILPSQYRKVPNCSAYCAAEKSWLAVSLKSGKTEETSWSLLRNNCF